MCDRCGKDHKPDPALIYDELTAPVELTQFQMKFILARVADVSPIILLTDKMAADMLQDLGKKIMDAEDTIVDRRANVKVELTTGDEEFLKSLGLGGGNIEV